MKPSEFLETLDSHGIYSASDLDKLDEQYRDCVPRFTVQQTVAAIERRGLGGDLRAEVDDMLIYGWTTAQALASHLLGDSPGAGYFGRGSAFRADLAAIRKAGY